MTIVPFYGLFKPKPSVIADFRLSSWFAIDVMGLHTM
jgi:hypothetical protein